MSTSVGTVKCTVKIRDNTSQKIKFLKVNAKNALRAMAEATLQRSRMLAPVLTGALRTSGRVEEKDEKGKLRVAVIYGSDSGDSDIKAVKYARRRHFENNLHPETKYYLKNAGDTVAKEGIKKYL